MTTTPRADDDASAPAHSDERILLHACCGPCASHCIQVLRRQGLAPTLFFANDNLSTQTEFDRRLEALATVARIEAVPLVVADYRHSSWLAAVRGCESAGEGGVRCSACFRHNLSAAARHAAAQGFPRFTTSLSVSPHKRSAQLFEAGRLAVADLAAGGPGRPAPDFLPLDFKKNNGFLHSVALSREYGLYRQSHCGCEFSQRT